MKKTTIYNFLLISLFYCCSTTIQAQAFLDWFVLSDVKFEEKQIPGEELNYNQATFGPSIDPFVGQEVMISGYIIPMDPMGVSYVLSMNPNATCFFCGGAGPETVIQLNLAPSAIKRYKTDDRLTFKGVFRAHEDDIESLTYVLENAEEI